MIASKNWGTSVIENYCSILESNIKLSLQRKNQNWHHDRETPEIIIETALEQIRGGSAAARLWIGLGAGRSVTTVHIKILKNNEVIAERRFNETTTLPNIASDSWSNEDAILQDAHLIADKIAKFVLALLGVLSVFIGMVSLDAYYQRFGLQYHFLNIPTSHSIYRGLTIITHAWYILIPFLIGGVWCSLIGSVFVKELPKWIQPN